jgi:lipopolysaccharide biosynthesis glycosyltransferase
MVTVESKRNLGGDQGLLNSFFSSWSTGSASRRIPFTYNLTFSAAYSYAPAYKRYKDNVKIVHFIGLNKPWLFNRFSSDGKVIPHSDVSAEALELIERWWAIHDEFVPGKVRFTK